MHLLWYCIIYMSRIFSCLRFLLNFMRPLNVKVFLWTKKKKSFFDKSSKFGFPTIWPSVCAGPRFLWYWQWPVLSQVVNGREEIVTYGSRMLNPAEQKQIVLHKSNYSLLFMHWTYRLNLKDFSDLHFFKDFLKIN